MTKAKKFGTFGGVFTPSILTILGVIMYLRLPSIAGEAGLIGTLGIILVAHIISVTTGLSVSSIATDKKVREGGTYYIISRSLGLPIGGTLGIALFTGLSFSVSLYLIGFSESFLNYWDIPMNKENIRIAGTIILLAVTTLTFISTSLAIKTQYLIMTAIFLSLLSILFGKHEFQASAPNIFGSGTGIPLAVLFGIFFPAVTGFEAGVSMSGDLKDPKKSIPIGTISAITIGLIVYIGLAFFFTYKVDGNFLATDPKALLKIALVPQLVIAGIWGATLSSALGSILAAPRILQSTALDKITPGIFARGSGISKEPRNALLLTFLIAEAGILIGELDVIARIVTIFFITTYGFLNLSAAFESLTSPDFRPSFRTPSWVSITGFIACFLVMIQLDLLAMVGAIIILGLLFLTIKRRQLVLETGDAWSSVWASLVRKGLEKLNRSGIHNRNWRPNIILFCGKDDARPHLVEMANTICGKLGLYSAFEMVVSDEIELSRDKSIFSSYGKNNGLTIHQHKCRDIYEGMDEISRIYGFSGVEPDTILMGWSMTASNRDNFIRTIRKFQKSDFNSIYLHYNPLRSFGGKRTIDVWWSGWGGNLTFSLFLLRHITTSGDWKDAKMRIMIISPVLSRQEAAFNIVARVLNKYRMSCEIRIIDNTVDKISRYEIIARESNAIDMTIIGIPDDHYKGIESTYDNIFTLSEKLGSFILVNSSSRFEEFDLGFEKLPELQVRTDEQSELDLPALKMTAYEAINNFALSAELRGSESLKKFYGNTFIPVFDEVRDLADKTAATVRNTLNRLETAFGQKERSTLEDRIYLLRNEFCSSVSLVFSSFSGKGTNAQKEALEYGVKWYLGELGNAADEFPESLSVDLSSEALSIKKSDSLSRKLKKLSYYLKKPSSPGSINLNIRIREPATYYLAGNRQQSIEKFLKKLVPDISKTISGLRGVITETDSLLEASPGMDKSRIIARENELNNRLREINDEIESMQVNLKRSLLLEYRGNIQLLLNDLEREVTGFNVRLKFRKKNYYENLRLSNLGFYENWYDFISHYLGRINIDIQLMKVKSSLKSHLYEFMTEVRNQFENDFSGIKELFSSGLPGQGSSIAVKAREIRISQPVKSNSLSPAFRKSLNEMLAVSDILPENIRIISGENDGRIISYDENIKTIPLRSMVRFYLESEFLGPVLDFLEKEAALLNSSISEINELLNLIRFNIENQYHGDEATASQTEPLVAELLTKTDNDRKRQENFSENLELVTGNALESVFSSLSSWKIDQTLNEFRGLIREKKGETVSKTFHQYYKNLTDYIRYFSSRLLYSRSEVVILAKKVLESDQNELLNNEIAGMIEGVKPKPEITASLPEFYRKLFSGHSGINNNFLVERKEDEDLFAGFIKNRRAGYKGAILITGERNSGKTTFCKHVLANHYTNDLIYHLFAPATGSADLNVFTDELIKLTGISSNLKGIMEMLPAESVIVIHDLELWWNRSEEGWSVLSELKSLINDYSHKILFVLNVNPYALALYNSALNFSEVACGLVNMSPFRSKEINEMIMLRHHAAGFRYVINGRNEDELSEIRVASLFNKYFNYCEGNPGVALKAWLSNIIRVDNRIITIKEPAVPVTSCLERLPAIWKVVLANLVIHKRMGYNTLKMLMGKSDTETRQLVMSLIRCGLLEEKKQDLLVVNRFIEPFLIKWLKDNKIL